MINDLDKVKQVANGAENAAPNGAPNQDQKIRRHIHDTIKVLERERERLLEENRIEAAKCQVESHIMLRNNKHLKEIKSLIESGYRWIEKLSQREKGKEVPCN